MAITAVYGEYMKDKDNKKSSLGDKYMDSSTVDKERLTDASSSFKQFIEDANTPRDNTMDAFREWAKLYLEKFSNSFKSEEEAVEYFEKQLRKQFEGGESFTEYLGQIEKDSNSCTYEEAYKFVSDSTVLAWLRITFNNHEWDENLIIEALERVLGEYFTKPLSFTSTLSLTPITEERVLSTAVINEFKIPKSRLHQKVWSGQLKNEAYQITLFDYENQRGEQLQASTNLVASIKDLPGVKGIEGLTSNDEDIHNSILSLYDAGRTVFTNATIYKTLMGKNVDLTDKKDKEITDFIENAVVTRLKIDTTNEAKALGKEPIIYEDNFLDMAKVTHLDYQGQKVESAWIIKSRPILGAYAEFNNQIISIDRNLLDTGTRAEYNALKMYLIKQISWLKNKKSKRSNKLKLDTIYRELGITSRAKRKGIRDNAVKILNHFKSMKWIDDYKLNYVNGYNNAKQLDSITIFYTDKKQLKNEG